MPSVLIRKLFIALFLMAVSVGLLPSDAGAVKPKVDSVRLYTLDCGSIRFQDFAMFSDTGTYDGKPRELSDMCLLVGHPKGWLLWDTGLPKAFKEKPAQEFGANMKVTRTIQEQLADIGLTTDDINYVAFSHFHFDHTGNANDFTKSTWILQKSELAHGLSEPAPLGVDASVFSAYKTANKTMIEGDHDVFGDGSVRFFSTPGHTPGHQSLFVKLSKQNYLFTGDLYHQEESRLHSYIPIFNHNRANTLASMDRLENLAKTYQAKVIVQHDKQDFDSLPKVPKYLD